MMAYATTSDMTSRFGESEILRLSSGDGPLPGAIVEPNVARALDDATAIVESFLRRRYLVPVAQPTADIVRAVCILARYDLSTGADKEPTTQMKDDRAATIAWLKAIADGGVTLEGAAPVSAGAGLQAADRPRLMTSDNLGLM
jgi:phage gp36-like protein